MIEKKIIILSDNDEWAQDFENAFKEIGKKNLVKIIDFKGPKSPDIPKFEEVGVIYARPSPSAEKLRNRINVNKHILDVVLFYESKNIKVVNGSKAIKLEYNKDRQFKSLSDFKIPIPHTVPVYNVRTIGDIVKAAEQIEGGFLIKPNKGGSGYGIKGFNSIDDLLNKHDENSSVDKLDYEPGSIVIVQEEIPHENPADTHIFRFEYIGYKLLYAVKVRVTPGQYNNCPADCLVNQNETQEVKDGKFKIVDVKNPLNNKVINFLKSVESEIAGVEFIKNSGEFYCIDPNVTNTNYGRIQEFAYNKSKGYNISGHRRVAEYLLNQIHIV